MKKVVLLFVVFFVVFSCLSADENTFEFTMMPYLKEGFDEASVKKHRYVFENGLLKSIYIDDTRTGKLEQKEVHIVRTPGLVQVFDADKKLLMSCELIDKENFVITVSHLPNKTFVTMRNNNAIYGGVPENIAERFWHIQKDKPLVFYFRRNGVPINSGTMIDFYITDSDESGVKFLDKERGYYKKIDANTFEDASYNPLELPGTLCKINRNIKTYSFSVVDMFINYFCGSGMSYPIIWGQLIIHSSAADIFSTFVF